MEIQVQDSGVQLEDWLNNFLNFNREEVFDVLRDHVTRSHVVQAAHRLVYQAYIEANTAALDSLHNILQAIYGLEFSGTEVQFLGCERKPILADISSILEVGMLAHETGKISKIRCHTYPQNGDDFVPWFRAMLAEHGASKHEFYERYLPARAGVEDIEYFLVQETSLDPRFDDILALMQVGRSGQEKMEIASNYWDEMGNGEAAMVHTTLFSQALKSLGIDQDQIARELSLEAKVSGNISACLALSRRHYYRAVGYFGVTELLAPKRFKSLVKAWERLDLPRKGIQYHELHLKIDAIHGNAWLKNVIKPLIDGAPAVGADIIEGALIRLNSSSSYLDAVLSVCEQRNANRPEKEVRYAAV